MADTKLRVIVSAVDRASGPLGHVANGIDTLGRRAAKAALIGIGAMTAGLVKLSSEAASLQAIEDSFMDLAQTATRSGAEMLFSLREASNQMVSNTELMKSYNQATLLVSEQFANQLPDAMEYLGRISATTGQSMSYLLNSLVTGVGRLSIRWLDNLQVVFKAEDAYKKWADANNKAVSEMTQAEKQMAFMGEAMSQLKEKTKGMTSLVDPFVQLKTVLINLKDRVAKAIGPTMLAFFSDLAEEIEDFVSSDEFHEWLQASVKWLKDELIPALKDGVAIIKGWIDKLAEVTPEQWENAAAFAETAVKVLAVVYALDKLIIVFKAVEAFSSLGVFTGIAKAATTAAGVSGVGGVAGLVTSFGGLAASIGAVMLPLLPLIAALGALWLVIKFFGEDAANSLGMLWEIAKIKLHNMGIDIFNTGEKYKNMSETISEAGETTKESFDKMAVSAEDYAKWISMEQTKNTIGYAQGLAKIGEEAENTATSLGTLEKFMKRINDSMAGHKGSGYASYYGLNLASSGWTYDPDTGWSPPPGEFGTTQSSPQSAPLQSPIIVNFNAPVLGFTDEYELAQKLAPVLARVQR